MKELGGGMLKGRMLHTSKSRSLVLISTIIPSMIHGTWIYVYLRVEMAGRYTVMD